MGNGGLWSIFLVEQNAQLRKLLHKQANKHPPEAGYSDTCWGCREDGHADSEVVIPRIAAPQEHRTPATKQPTHVKTQNSTNFFSFSFFPFLHKLLLLLLVLLLLLTISPQQRQARLFLAPKKKNTHTHTTHTHTHTPHIHTHMNTCARNEKGKTKRNPMPGLGNEEMGVKENREKVEGGRWWCSSSSSIRHYCFVVVAAFKVQAPISRQNYEAPTNSNSVGCFVSLACQGKDIVFSFIIEYSSLRDFGPY